MNKIEERVRLTDNCKSQYTPIAICFKDIFKANDCFYLTCFVFIHIMNKYEVMPGLKIHFEKTINAHEKESC